MRVFVTGATGLVGAHTALALLQAGHELRLLVRNRAAAERWFAAQGYQLDDFVVADMLDRDAVLTGMAGCHAVVHAAALVDLNIKNAEQTLTKNLAGVDNVVGGAHALGIKKILYVSSMAVLIDPRHEVLHEELELAEAKDAYARSKRMCEEKIRDWQEAGAPIITTYPSGVFGVEDPKLSESNMALLKFLTLLVPLTSSGFQFVDARDLGRVHTKLLELPLPSDRCKARYITAGHFLPWQEFAQLLDVATNKRLTKVPLPGAIFRMLGWLFDASRRFISIEFPISREAMMLVTQLPPADSSRLLAVVDNAYRPALETLVDTSRWLLASEHIK
ncbi:MAG: NAD-dependent epimerase/dehydratase family protein [Spongiibacteraceae bacterium]